MRVFRRKIQSIRRLRQILRVLAGYGFGYLTGRLNLQVNRFSKFRTARKLELAELSPPQRMRRSLEELGGTFVKLGQMLSTRPDLIPLRFCRELEKLQDRVPPCRFEQIAKQIKSQFNVEVDELFENFSRDPIAGASLSQVHSAELKTGEKVVVKVQRPGVETYVLSDLELLNFLARMTEKYIEESRFYNPVGVVSEFRRMVSKEMDFTVEARNIERFRKNFEDDDTACFPAVFHEYSGRRVLTMERIDGIKISELDRIEDSGLDRKQIALNGARIIIKQIFSHGFFHSDPHPGNIFALEGNRIAMLDLGQVGRLHRNTRAQVANMLVGAFEKDSEEVIETFKSMGMTPEDPLNFELDIEDLVSRYYGITLSELRIGEFLSDLMSIVNVNRISVQADLFVLSKSMITIESVGRELYPELDMTSEMKPFIETLIRQKYDPRILAKDVKKFSASGARLARSLPGDISDIISKLKSGTTRIEFEHQGLEDFILHMDKVSNRISFSLIIAALIIGSTLVMMTDKGPMLLEFPMLGIIGFIAAGVMGLWLVIAILRSGKL